MTQDLFSQPPQPPLFSAAELEKAREFVERYPGRSLEALRVYGAPFETAHLEHVLSVLVNGRAITRDVEGRYWPKEVPVEQGSVKESSLGG